MTPDQLRQVVAEVAVQLGPISIGEGFPNPVAGGDGTLVYPNLHSPDYVPGVSGWSINADGSAEFNEIILPGGGGGITATFAATAPATPATGDLWYNTANGMQLSQWDGSSWVVHLLSTGAIGPGAIVSSQLAPSVTARALGGITTTILASPPTFGNFAGDLWLDVASGYQLKRWDGSAWVPVAWDASNVIQAGTIQALQILAHTITATQIAAGTITANEIHANTIGVGQLAAGIVYAGIVDATTVTGATLQNSSTNPKTSINPDGSVTITNASGTVLFKIGPDGTMDWYSATGSLMMELQPGGTTLIYANATGPVVWDFEGTTNGWAAISATLASSAVWAANGNNSLLITHSGSAQPWGATSPAFPVTTPGSTVTVVGDMAAASASVTGVSCYVTFWSGPNGTGSNLGTVAGDQAAFTASPATADFPISVTGALIPAGAVSVTFTVQSTQTAAGSMYVDYVLVAGGLAYSNSPVSGIDRFGNPYPQGTNYVGIPGQTNILGVADAYGRQLVSIDGGGDISAVFVNAVDVNLSGSGSVAGSLAAAPQGIVNRGWTPGAAGAGWPASPITAAQGEVALLELDTTIPAGRRYALRVVPADFVVTTLPSANAQYIQRLRFTTDGSTPSTSSPEITGHSTLITPVLSATALNYMTPYMDYIPSSPGADTLYRVLLSASITNGGAYSFRSSLEMRWEDLGEDDGQFGNSGVILGTGGSGGSGGTQTFTEYFYGNSTWTYNEFGLRNTNGTIYQGAYSGEGFAQYAFIQFSTGTRGHNLNTVLNYPQVNWVKFRLLNQHSWYNSGMTVSLHSATSLNGTRSVELTSWHINEGQQLAHAFTNWSAFKAAGTTYAVLYPPSGSLDLSYYGYFWGGGGNNANVPAMIVNYTN